MRHWRICLHGVEVFVQLEEAITPAAGRKTTTLGRAKTAVKTGNRELAGHGAMLCGRGIIEAGGTIQKGSNGPEGGENAEQETGGTVKAIGRIHFEIKSMAILRP